MFKSWLICCRKVSSQLEGQNPGLGPPLPPGGHHDSPFSSQIYFKLRRDLRLISSRQVFLRYGPSTASRPTTSRRSTSPVYAGPVRDLPDFRSTPARWCMHFTPVLLCSSALITPGSLQFWVVISSQASRVQAPPHTEPHPPHGSAPPACLRHLKSPSLAVWLPLSVDVRGGASPPQRSSQRKSTWTCRSHHRWPWRKEERK